MDTSCSVAALVVVLGCACVAPEPDTGGPHLRRGTSRIDDKVETDETLPAVGYGWERAISVTNFGAAAAKRSGRATSSLAGHGLHDIVSDRSLAVRADGNPCTSCHAWAEAETKADFCERVPAFLALPTATGTDADPEEAKPKLLKDLLQRWKEAGCPD